MWCSTRLRAIELRLLSRPLYGRGRGVQVGCSYPSFRMFVLGCGFGPVLFEAEFPYGVLCRRDVLVDRLACDSHSLLYFAHRTLVFFDQRKTIELLVSEPRCEHCMTEVYGLHLQL